MTQPQDDVLLDAIVLTRTDPVPGLAIFDLAAADGGSLPPHAAGAHVEITIGDDLVRQYSLCTRPDRPGTWRIGVLRDPASRGGSVAIHERFAAGTRIRVGTPRNHFPLHQGAGKALLFGGGIGITPMLAMAYELSAAGRPFELHYSVRSLGLAGFLDEIAEAFGAAATIHADDGPAAQKLDLTAVLAAQPAGTHVYVCGPTGYMDWVIATAKAAGFPSDHVHFEYFAATVDTHGAAFEVVAKRSGKTVTVGEGDTILAALARAGVKIKKSCEQGVCGTCLCDVLEGEPDHKDKFLNDEERADGDQIITCCSRSKSPRLVLDV